MTKQIHPKERLAEPIPVSENLESGCEDAFHLQEQFTGLVPLRGERPAAELLAKCQAGAEPAEAPLLFIP